MKTLAVTASLAAALAAVFVGGAGAQAMDNVVSTFAGAADLAGQGMAAGVMAGPSVFVTAVGHAPRPSTSVKVFVVDLEASARQAGAAERDLAGKIDLALAAARRLSVRAAVTDHGFEDTDAANPMAALMKAQANKDDKAEAAETPKMTAKASIELTATDAAQEALFLDALAAGHLDYKLAARGKSLIPGLDIGRPPPQVDQASWDEATRAAMIEAGRQAALVAAAANEAVGEARQIVILTRSTEASQVNVTIAVRFALKPKA